MFCEDCGGLSTCCDCAIEAEVIFNGGTPIPVSSKLSLVTTSGGVGWAVLVRLECGGGLAIFM